MDIQTLSIKRMVMGGLTAAMLVLPITFTAGAAQASRGSFDVRGNPSERAMAVTGETAKSQAAAVPASSSDQTSHLTLAQRAINPVLNPNKPVNSGH